MVYTISQRCVHAVWKRNFLKGKMLEYENTEKQMNVGVGSDEELIKICFTKTMVGK